MHYRVPLTPDEAAARLSAQVDRPSLLYHVIPALTTGASFVGSVSSSQFFIRVRRRSYNSLAASAEGIIRAVATGSEIDARIGVGAAIRHALAVFIGLIGVLGVLPQLAAGVPTAAALSIAAVCVIAAVLVWRRGGDDLGFPSSEAHQLKELLDTTFRSERLDS